jgi:predicted nucleic-acid-binding Zn-ribbon protein
MKNGKCPKCGSATVHSKPGGLGFGNSSRVNIYVGSMGKPSPTTAYVCVTCGYFELYLTGTSYFAEVAQAWPKVSVKG